MNTTKPQQKPYDPEDSMSPNQQEQVEMPNSSQVISARERERSMLSESQDSLMCRLGAIYEIDLTPEKIILLTTKPYNQLPQELQEKVPEKLMYRHWTDYPLVNNKENPYDERQDWEEWEEIARQAYPMPELPPLSP
jgi:hypothetical protein